VTSIRQLNKLAKNVSSVSKDDSLTSLDWLSCLGTPQPSVKEPRPAQYTPKELIRLSFRLARHDVSKLKKKSLKTTTQLTLTISSQSKYWLKYSICVIFRNRDKVVILAKAMTKNIFLFSNKNVFFWRA
jgi:hypothetical protein